MLISPQFQYNKALKCKLCVVHLHDGIWAQRLRHPLCIQSRDPAWWTGACAQGCCCVGKSQGEGFSFLEYLCMPPFPPSFSAKSAVNRFLLAWSPLYFTKEGEALPILCQTSSVHVPVMLKNQEAVVGPMEVLHLTPPRVWQGFLRYPRWFPPPHLWCFTPLFF